MARTVDSEAQRKTYNHPCLIAQSLDVLGDRWTLLIIRDLMAGLHRYSDILENCHGMSPNVLSDRLKRLEADGLVDRLYERGLPPKIEYNLTEKGWAVRPVLQALIGWSREFVPVPPVAAVGDSVPTDFAIRTASAFAFQPERAAGVNGSLVVEIDDCSGVNAWTFVVHDGYLHPRRNAIEAPDARLRTSTAGFFRFLSGKLEPAECGEITGSEDAARAIQSCFLR